jgi:hypothetical protein
MGCMNVEKLRGVSFLINFGLLEIAFRMKIQVRSLFNEYARLGTDSICLGVPL